ncbi:activator-dependent family glycosyltransferase [Kutzneria sp. NPDC052558]|uniref:activator-dependent family glycosyltransferase n=1 Tax=Kutzneria sp. NPDC052558 TaxID=3364121 RepID=UPI0037CA718E
MRVLFVVLSENSHLYVQVPLAWAMTTAGHEVRVASNPGMGTAISRTGLTAVGVGQDHDLADTVRRLQREGVFDTEMSNWSRALPHQTDWDEALSKWDAMRMAWDIYSSEGFVADLVDYCRDWRPDLIVWDQLSIAGAIAGHVLGIPHTRLVWAVDVYDTMRTTFLTLQGESPDRADIDPLRDWLAQAVGRYGREYHEELVTGQWSTDLVPASLQLPLASHREAVRFTPFHGPSIAPAWAARRPERPRVLLTTGLSYRGDSLYLPVRDIMAALGDLDAEIIATLDPNEVDPSSVPSNTRLVGFVPLNAVLPECSAVIHHVGTGTRMTSALHGVPQYMLPNKDSDLFAFAEAMESVKAGLYTHSTTATAEQIRDGVHRLLTEPAFADGAGRLRQEMLDTPSPNDSVLTLLRLAEQHR